MLFIPRFKRFIRTHVKINTDYRRLLSIFELTTATLTAQLYNLGMCQKGPVVAMGLVCGNALLNGSMQQEGFDAIVSGVYGISCVAYSTMTLVTSVLFINLDELTHDDLAYYLLAWAWINLIFFIRSLHYKRVFQSLFFFFITLGTGMQIICNIATWKHTIPDYIILFSLLFPVSEMSIGIFNLNPVKDPKDAESIDVLKEVSQCTGISVFDPI
jgi:hypothetical protein